MVSTLLEDGPWCRIGEPRREGNHFRIVDDGAPLECIIDELL